MSDPNSRQVGGDHYKSAYEHWDFVEDIKLGYLESVAIKYVARWRKKNGIQDLEKADHYIEKLIAVGRFNVARLNEELLDKFLRLNVKNSTDMMIIITIVEWETRADLLTARDLIKELSLRHHDGTPLTDSNRHAR